jgi:GNAT superfamily N-acetyltransferase
MATDVQIVISDNKEFLDIEIVHGFLKRSSWAANRTRETLEKSISSSICFGAYAEKKQVAFARIVSDVFVDENYRGRGISKELMTAIMKHPDLQSYRRFTLATENAHRLYAQFGFKNVPVNLFMEIKNDNI